MRYLSPYSLLDNPVASPLDRKALNLQKRRLLTDLELSEDGFLHIKDQSLSKSDILEYFETLEEDNSLLYHAAVSKDKILLEFLEDAQLLEHAFFTRSELYGDPNFIEWISPYFYTAFTSYVDQCFQINDASGLQTMLNNPILLTDFDRERAWIQIGQVLENRIAQLEHYFEQAEQQLNFTPVEEISDLTNETFVQMVRLLPEGPFTGLRDRFAMALMQNSIIFFNNLKDRRATMMNWMESARLLAASESMSKGVSEKIAEMDTLDNKTGGGLARIAVFAIFILLKVMIGSNGCHSDQPTYKVDKFQYINGKDTNVISDIKKADSLMHNRLYGDSSKNH